MPLPIVCATAALCQCLEALGPLFSKPRRQYLVTVLLGRWIRVLLRQDATLLDRQPLADVGSRTLVSWLDEGRIPAL
jgi:hypothetical protein